MYAQNIIKKILYTITFLAVICYSIFRLYDLISGPKIEIYYPANGEKVDNVFTVTGRITNADKIYLYDREVLVNESGEFREEMIANKSYTDIKIKATNRWKKESSKSITVENVNYQK